MLDEKSLFVITDNRFFFIHNLQPWEILYFFIESYPLILYYWIY